MKTSSPGFTLIELSIALVIIALLVGGIIIGRELIHIAEIRATVSQIGMLDTSINTFKSKYKCLPGDCVNGAALGFTTMGYAPNGNGNGVLDETAEPFIAIGLLYQAGLVKSITRDSYSGFPAVAPKVPSLGFYSFHSAWYTGAWWPMYFYSITDGSVTKAGHYYWATSFSGIAHLYPDYGIFSTADAYAIDSKVDDGLPRSGNTMATGEEKTASTGGNVPYPTFIDGVDNAGAAGPSNPQCITNTNLYNVQNPTRALCSITVKASF